MSNLKHNEIVKAAEILNLGETASIEKIKKNYKTLIVKWHPDKCQNKLDRCKEMTQQINHAYEALMKYCFHYEISFRKEDVEKATAQNDDSWWFTRFGDDPIWGK